MGQYADYLAPLMSYAFTPNEEEGAQKKYEDLIQQSLDEFGRIDPAKLRELTAEQSGPSAYDGIAADPRLAQSQMSALDRLNEIANSGGMTVQDRAKLNDIEGQANSAAQSRRQGIVSAQRRRGMGGSGAELSALLSGAGEDSNAQAQGSYNVHAAASQRALDALKSGAGLAGDIRQQDFGEQATKAGARDHLAEFNAKLRQEAALANQRRDQQVISNQMSLGRDRADLRSQKGKAGIARAQRDEQRGAATGRFIGGLVGGAADLSGSMHGFGGSGDDSDLLSKFKGGAGGY